jgi:hypothetical protein
MSLSDADQWKVAIAMSILPELPPELNLTHCAAHPVPALRALAGASWAKDPSTLPFDVIKRLTRDSEFKVRLAMAAAIRRNLSNPVPNTERNAIAQILSLDPRRSVREQMLRRE